MEHILKESILQELINKAQWPPALSLDKVTPIVYRGFDMLKGAGIGFSSFEDGKKPAIGDIIGIAGKLSGEVGKFGPVLKGSEKLQTVLSVVDVLLSYLEGVKPVWAGDLAQLKSVARDVLPASLSFAVSVAKGEFDLGSVFRKPEGVAHLEHGRSLFRRVLGFVRRLTPVFALCGVSSAAAEALAAVDPIEPAPRRPATSTEVEAESETVGMILPVIQSEKEPVAPPPTPRPSLEEPLGKEEVPPPTLESIAEEVRSSSTVTEPTAQEPSNPTTDSRQILYDA